MYPCVYVHLCVYTYVCIERDKIIVRTANCIPVLTFYLRLCTQIGPPNSTLNILRNQRTNRRSFLPRTIRFRKTLRSNDVRFLVRIFEIRAFTYKLFLPIEKINDCFSAGRIRLEQETTIIVQGFFFVRKLKLTLKIYDVPF